MGCPQCGSDFFENTGRTDTDYNLAKGMVGEALIGTAGALSGFENKKIVKCKKCGCEYTLEDGNKKAKVISSGSILKQYEGRGLKEVVSVPCSTFAFLPGKKIIVGYENFGMNDPTTGKPFRRQVRIWFDYALDGHGHGLGGNTVKYSYKKKKIEISGNLVNNKGNSTTEIITFQNESDLKKVIDALETMTYNTTEYNDYPISIHELTDKEETKDSIATGFAVVCLIAIGIVILSLM